MIYMNIKFGCYRIPFSGSVLPSICNCCLFKMSSQFTPRKGHLNFVANILFCWTKIIALDTNQRRPLQQLPWKQTLQNYSATLQDPSNAPSLVDTTMNYDDSHFQNMTLCNILNWGNNIQRGVTSYLSMSRCWKGLQNTHHGSNKISQPADKISQPADDQFG